MPDVVCLGELLIDFLAEEPNRPLSEVPAFRRAPGGAPANVACGVARLGRTAGFIGKIGSEPFGDFLQETLRQAGVDTSHLARTDRARTTLAFVGVHDDGRKEIFFYRNPGADMLLGPDDIDESYVAAAACFHFGSISLIDPGPKAATIRAAEAARRAGRLVSFDPNWRPALWDSPERGHLEIRTALSMADVVKVSQEEWRLVTGTDDLGEGARRILAAGPRLVVVSRGEQGCYFHHASGAGAVAGFRVPVVECTGAGDGFVASILVDLLDHRDSGGTLDDLDPGLLQRLCRRANAVGALACTKAGAIPALPTRAEADALIAATQ
ncbi:MAG TPA: carbohydrate kinase [Phycisphaerae bacterium]|nr:carbohydrate kinase [Phycisphaerae bacterium]